jgi:flavin reductase (DIM6/NTAB) family NADH-FMN oxidoreductase RutF
MSATIEHFDQRQLRDALGTFVTGVTVVTTRDKNGVAHGVTVNSFSSVSIEPPLILWSQALTSRSYSAFRDTDHFAVSILADDQVAISNHFAKSHDDKFSGVAHSCGLGDVPVVDGAAAFLECVKVESHLVGDHMLYIGRVERIGKSSRQGLAFSDGKYMRACSYEGGT